MTDQTAEQPPEAPSEAPKEMPPGARRRRSFLPILCAAALILLAVANGLLWVRVLNAPPPPDARPTVAALEARLAKLEDQPRPAATETDLVPRIEALERRAAPDLTAIRTRITNLEQRPAEDLAALTARVAVLERSLARADRVARVQAAAVALAAGQPLGEIPNAPNALARFAHTKPPTEAALRLTFPAAAEAALDASRPVDEDRPFADRLLARAESLVTVRRGDRVVVGDPASGLLVKARTAVDAGDLSGAIAALSGLRDESKAAMAGWLADATALRDARAALVDMASQP